MAANYLGKVNKMEPPVLADGSVNTNHDYFEIEDSDAQSSIATINNNISTIQGNITTINNNINSIQTQLAGKVIKYVCESYAEFENIVQRCNSGYYQPSELNEKLQTIFWVPPTEPDGGATNNVYTEYVIIDKGSGVTPRYVEEIIGTTEADLENYSHVGHTHDVKIDKHVLNETLNVSGATLQQTSTATTQDGNTSHRHTIGCTKGGLEKKRLTTTPTKKNLKKGKFARTTIVVSNSSLSINEDLADRATGLLSGVDASGDHKVVNSFEVVDGVMRFKRYDMATADTMIGGSIYGSTSSVTVGGSATGTVNAVTGVVALETGDTPEVVTGVESSASQNGEVVTDVSVSLPGGANPDVVTGITNSGSDVVVGVDGNTGYEGSHSHKYDKASIDSMGSVKLEKTLAHTQEGGTGMYDLLTTLADGGGDPRIKQLKAENLSEGDMLFYDRLMEDYGVVKKGSIASVLADFNHKRYETNYDTYIGTVGGKAHFTAITDAYSQNGMYTGEGDAAAANNYYRIEIDNTQAGSITFYSVAGEASWAIGTAAEPVTVSWSANEAMSTIAARFVALNKSYNVFAALADGKGVGLKVGGYGTNTLTITASSHCTVIDCSGLSFLRTQNPAAPAVGGDFNPNAAWTYLGYGVHRSFRGSTASAILSGAYPNIIGSDSTAIAVDGYNYSYRCGLNFAKWKSWASTGGESTFYDDGEDEQTGGQHVANPGAHVMNETTFNAGVRDYTGSDVQHLGMKDYYTHLFTDQSGEYAQLRQELESHYGQMTSMYDAYLMNHMLDAGANSGITNAMRNKGFDQTAAKADLMTVTYDYKIVPVYPPEYNAQQYGNGESEGFAPGKYYHPEPADLALCYRDDNMAKVNANVDTINSIASNTGSKISNSAYRGSCADYGGNDAWFFSGGGGGFDYYRRCYGGFRSRPSLALPLQS